MRHPGRGQSSPRLFFNPMCSAISSARTLSLVCTFFFKSSIRFCFSSAWRRGRSAVWKAAVPFSNNSFCSDRTPWAAIPVPHTDRKPQPCLKDGIVGSPPFPQRCSACAFFSYVRSAILTDERFLHFQLRQDRWAKRIPFRMRVCPAPNNVLF
jgi:hypothetical protein